MERNLNIEIKNIQKLKLEQIFFKDFISFPYYSLIEFLKREAEDNPFLDFEFDESKISEKSYGMFFNYEWPGNCQRTEKSY